MQKPKESYVISYICVDVPPFSWIDRYLKKNHWINGWMDG